MRISKFLVNPVLVVFTVVTFLFLTTGCNRTVTKYDANGKPYSEEEFDPWGTVGAVVLTMFVFGAIAAAAAPGGSSLPVEHETMFAYAGNKGIIYDARSGIYNPVKRFRLTDSEGNLISEHFINIDKLMANRPVVNVSDVQASVKVNEKMLKKLVNEMAKANNLKSVPGAIKTEISFRTDEKNTLSIGAVSIPEDKSQESRVSELTVTSEEGVYKVSTILNEKPWGEAGQLSVTVSQLN